MGFFRKLFGKETTTDILELLAAQHKEVDALFKQIRDGDGNRRELLTELADKLSAHAAAEEKLFYPAIMADDTEALLKEAVEEHLSIKRMLVDVVGSRPGTKEFDAKLAVLEEQVTHHAHQEEESKVFPEVRSMFNADERAALGNEFLALFEELMLSHPYKNTPNELDAPAPLPKR